jgi:hypothetical protein
MSLQNYGVLDRPLPVIYAYPTIKEIMNAMPDIIRPLTAEATFQSQVSPYAILVDKVAMLLACPLVLLFYPISHDCTKAPYFFICYPWNGPWAN